MSLIYINPYSLAAASIVTDGLVLNLDAGDPASYPGSGTTWTDLSATGRNGTIFQASFSDNSFSFDGTDDKVNLSSGFSITNNFTVNFGVFLQAHMELIRRQLLERLELRAKNIFLG